MFKNGSKDLNKIGSAIKSLNSIDIKTNGVNANNLNTYKMALKGLSAEQTIFALSSKGATVEQMRLIMATNGMATADIEAAIAKAGLATTTQALTQSEMVEIAVKNGLAKEEAELLLSKLGIIAVEEGQLPVKKQVTLATIEQAVASGALTAQEGKLAISMLGLTAAEGASVKATNLLTASFVKLWTTISKHPVGTILTALGAITIGVVSYANNAKKKVEETNKEYIESQKEIINKANDSISATQSEITELENLRHKLEDVKNSKSGLLALSEDVDNALGNGTSYILNHANAYSVLTAKINANIAAQKKIDEKANTEKNNAIFNTEKNRTVKMNYNNIPNDQRSFMILEPYETISSLHSKHTGDYIDENIKYAENFNYSAKEFAKIYARALEKINLGEVESVEDLEKAFEESFENTYTFYENFLSDENNPLGEIYSKQIINTLVASGFNIYEDDKVFTDIFNRIIGNTKLDELWGDYSAALLTSDPNDEKNLLTLIDNELAYIAKDYPQILKVLGDYGQGMIDAFNDELYKNKIKKPLSFESLISTSKYKDTVDSLKQLTISGELSPELLSSMKEYSELMEVTGLSADELCNKIKEVTLSSTSISDIISSIKTLNEIVNTVDQEIAEYGSISSSTLQKIAQQYPTMSNYVLDYTYEVDGAQDRLVNALKTNYQNDLNNYSGYYMIKMGNDVTFYKQIVSNLDESIKTKAKSYGIDLEKFVTYLSAKEKLEEEYANTSQKIASKTMGLRLAWSAEIAIFGKEKADDNFAKRLEEANQEPGFIEELQKILDESFDSSIEMKDFTKDLFQSSDLKPSNTPTIFDWIETKISKIQTKVSDLASTVSNTFKSFGKRSSALSSETSAISEQISILNSAYSQYMNKANSIDIPEYYKSSIQNGSFDISIVKDSKEAERINQYKEWYEKAKNCLDIIKELNDEADNLAKQKIDLISEDFENKLGVIQSKASLLESYISQNEANGYMISADFYKELSNIEKQNNSFLQQEKNALTSALNDAVNSGEIDKYSTEWYSLNQQIDDITQAIVESDTALQGFSNSMREVGWSTFEYLQDTISNITEESEFLIDILSNKKLSDDKGLTQYGDATLGLHAVNYEIYLQQAKQYGEKIDEINRQLATDPYNQTLIEKKNEYIDLQRESISASEDEKQAMIDLVKEGYDAELNSLNVLIDKYKEVLQSKKDENDYQKNISEQTKNINNLKKQLMAYKGNDSEEIRTTIQKLELSLKEAEDNLDETQYDNFISFQEDLFNELTAEYEEFIENKLESINDNINSLITEVSNKSTEISDTLSNVTSELGISLSTQMHSIWSNSTGSITTSINGVNSSMNGINSSVNNVLISLNNYIKSMSDAAIAAANQAVINTNTNTYTPTPAPTPAPAPTSTPPSSSSSSGSSFRSMFIYKKNSYPKNMLNINTSIVDRLKYYDFDSSTSARSSYWKNMGGDGTYIGSDSQNIWMLNQMKKNGFAKGGVVGDLISKTGEDGFVLARKNESILTEAQGEKLLEIIDKIHVLDSIRPKIDNLSKVPSYDFSQSAKSSNINIEMGDICLPNVTKPEEFANDFINIVKTNSKVQKVLKGATTDLLSGKSILNINKY